MAEFVESLQDRVDPKGVAEGWVRVVVETMEPSTVGLWLKEQWDHDRKQPRDVASDSA